MSEIYLRHQNFQVYAFNETERSVRVIAATENPIFKLDPFQGKMVYIVHLVDGVTLPPNGQVPLLDSHNQSSVSHVLGSARNFEITDSVLYCDVFFSGTQAGLEAARKVREGHLTDFSVGYLIEETSWIPEGQEMEIRGRRMQGPLRVNSKWRLLELSIASIGADINAKVHSGHSPGNAVSSFLGGRSAVDVFFYIVFAVMAITWVVAVFE